MNNPLQDTGTEVPKIGNENLSKTYKEVAQEFVVDEKFTSIEEIAGAMRFAESLDKRNVMSPEITLMAMQQARKIDRELLEAFIEAVGLDKAKEIARSIVNRHRHTKVCQEEAVQANVETKNVDEPKS